MTAISNRYDFVYLFDVMNGNPNGDPDAGNRPRTDPQTECGLVTDVCLKRKIRNYAGLARDGDPRFGIYVRDGSILSEQHRRAYAVVRPDDTRVHSAQKLSPQSDLEAEALRRFMCDNFFDVRTFGAVMSTGVNCGQVRGPVQFAFARSIDPIVPLDTAITRMAATNAGEKPAVIEAGGVVGDARNENRTMGRKWVVPYGLYRAHGFVSAKLAERTGFDDRDLGLLWESLCEMLEHDRSAARGEMTARKLIVFRHASALGNAHASDLFDRVTITRNEDGSSDPVPARHYKDYDIALDRSDMHSGVDVLEMI
jgi:CRISPR-associated protein Csd2